MYLRLAASTRGNMVYMLNILRWHALCENVYGFYSYYRPVEVTVYGDGANTHCCCLHSATHGHVLVAITTMIFYEPRSFAVSRARARNDLHRLLVHRPTLLDSCSLSDSRDMS